jgi:RNA ligase (TIGR02306 family)
MERPLAIIGMVKRVIPIEGAERIESLEVVCGSAGIWRGCAQKGQLKESDLCEVYLQDALLPETERFEFMRKDKFRIRMKRFLGVPSECLIMPLSIYHLISSAYIADIGRDITDIAGVKKYQKPVPACIQGETKGGFPSFIPKTDEHNVQSVPDMFAEIQEKEFYASTKIDGTSCTIYNYNGQFGVCSRNWEKKDTENNSMWQLVRKYDLQNKMNGKNIAIQCEVYGPGIQKNTYGAKEVGLAVFDIFDIDAKEYFKYADLVDTAKKMQIPLVPIVTVDIFNFSTFEQLQDLATGTYPSGKQIEGIVIRPLEPERIGNKRLSFKVLNLYYKD